MKTQRLRYAGTCAGCEAALPAGADGVYDRGTRTVRCPACVGAPAQPSAEVPPAHAARPARRPEHQRARRPARPAPCSACGRTRSPADLVETDDGAVAEVCRECVLLDLVHVVGLPGAGARAEFERRSGRRERRIRAAHPRLGGLILALSDAPQSTTAWARGAAGEEAFGAKLSEDAGPSLKVLHDRKRPGSSANIDHIAVTPGGVWVLDAKQYTGRIEVRGPGLFSRAEPDLYVGGRDRTKQVVAVQGQVEAVREVLASCPTLVGREPPPVRGALVFVDGEFGWFARPMEVRGVSVTWGAHVRAQLGAQHDGPYDASALARHLAAALRAGAPTRDSASA